MSAAHHYRAIGEAGPPLEKPSRIKTAPKPMNKVNRERRELLHERNYGAHGDFVRGLPCIITRVHPRLKTPCLGPTVAAHFHSKGAGGDKTSLFPACVGHHDEAHTGIVSFQERYELDLAREVEEICLADVEGLTEEERDGARLRLLALREAR